MTGLVVAVVVVAVVGLAIWAGNHVRHPEDTASHVRDPRASDSERFYSDTDRPAGPDAEGPVGGAHRRPDA